jgi:hypothetical protein
MMAQYEYYNNYTQTNSGTWFEFFVFFICSILFVAFVVLICMMFGKKEDEKRKVLNGKYPLLVDREVEFILEGDKLVRGRITSQDGDRLGISWMNRRREYRHTYRTIAKVSIMEKPQ